MRAAVSVAAAIYRYAGIECDWTVCIPSREPPIPYHMPADPPPFQVKVLAPGMGVGAASRSAFGFAVLPHTGHAAFLAYVFYRKVEEVARAQDIDTGPLLGIVLVHEVGHLLGLSDSVGVMRSSFTREDLKRAEKGLLRFSAADAGCLRAVFPRYKT